MHAVGAVLGIMMEGKKCHAERLMHISNAVMLLHAFQTYLHASHACMQLLCQFRKLACPTPCAAHVPWHICACVLTRACTLQLSLTT